MNSFTLNAKKVYRCLAILVSLVPAIALAQQQPQRSALPKLEESQNETLIQLGKEKNIPAKLIFNNKDLFEQNSTFLTQGPRTGGGGNSCSLAIAANTKQLREILDNSYLDSLLTDQQFKKLNVAMRAAKFYVTSAALAVGKQDKDAKNFPEEQIIIFTEHYCKTELADVSARSMSLLLHEYLGLAKVDDTAYEISGKFILLYKKLNEIDTGARRVSKYFLTQANKSGTKINKTINEARGNSETGFCHGDCPIARTLTSKNIQVVKTKSNVYIGTYRGPNNPSDAGSEEMTFEIFVPVHSVYYSGRIEEDNPLRFGCSLLSNVYPAVNPKITCEIIEK